MSRRFKRQPRNGRIFINPNNLTPTAAPRPTLLLRVETDYFVAGAVYEKVFKEWRCVRTAPILKWLKELPLAQTKIALLKMDATWSWSPTKK